MPRGKVLTPGFPALARGTWGESGSPHCLPVDGDSRPWLRECRPRMDEQPGPARLAVPSVPLLPFGRTLPAGPQSSPFL